MLKYGKLAVLLVVMPCLSLFAVPERRRDIDFREVPGKYLGQLKTKIGACTATLVLPKFILTAEHCLDKGNPGKGTFLFQRSFDKSTKEVAVVKVGAKGNGSAIGKGTDWAILELAEPLGETYGWMRPDFAAGVEGQSLSAIGYSSDLNDAKHPTIDPDCRVTEIKNDTLFSDCQGTYGASGGPIVANLKPEPALVGIIVTILHIDTASQAFFHSWVKLAVSEAERYLARAKEIIAPIERTDPRRFKIDTLDLEVFKLRLDIIQTHVDVTSSIFRFDPRSKAERKDREDANKILIDANRILKVLKDYKI